MNEAVHAGTEAVHAGTEAGHNGTEAVHAGMEAREGEIRSWIMSETIGLFQINTYMWKSVHLDERMEGCIILAAFDNIHKR